MTDRSYLVRLGTVSIGAYVRRAVNLHYGGDPNVMASIDRCRSFIRSNGELALDDCCHDLDQHEKGGDDA